MTPYIYKKETCVCGCRSAAKEEKFHKVFAEGPRKEITAVFFKKNIVEAVKQLFGEVGAAVTIDILRYYSEDTRAIIRVPKDFYIKLRISLTLCGKYTAEKGLSDLNQKENCAYIIHKASPLLLALQGDSRESTTMSHCRKLGPNNKDIVIFATKEDHLIPSKITLPKPDPQPGLILPNGDINWNCPCLGGMATGPCGVEFRNAFSCFHYSTAEPKGSDCFEKFKTMQSCMQRFPTLYNKDLTDDEDLNSMTQAEIAADAIGSSETGKEQVAASGSK